MQWNSRYINKLTGTELLEIKPRQKVSCVNVVRNDKIAKSNRLLARKLSLILRTGCPTNRTLHVESNTSHHVYKSSRRRRNFRREAVVVESGHQMLLRRGWPSSGAWDLKPQQWGLIGGRSVDKSIDVSISFSAAATCCEPWFLSDNFVRIHMCQKIFFL